MSRVATFGVKGGSVLVMDLPVDEAVEARGAGLSGCCMGAAGRCDDPAVAVPGGDASLRTAVPCPLSGSLL